MLGDNLLFHPRRMWRLMSQRLYDLWWYYILPDKLYLQIKYKQVHGVDLNLKDPQTIDEKLQWIKLYDRKPIYHMMIDKIEAKLFVERVLGTNRYTVPLLGKWESFEDIDFTQLPDRFVLKCNHDSCSWIIVRDKSKLDKYAARLKLTEALHRNYYHYLNKQWGYNNITPMIMAEEFLPDDKIEYQIFCNNGIPQFFLVRNDLGDSSGGFDICYSLNWEKLDYRVKKYDINIPSPSYICEMIIVATQLAKNTLHLRVDFYGYKDRFYVGELTFYSNGGDFHNFSERGKVALAKTLTLPIHRFNASNNECH